MCTKISMALDKFTSDRVQFTPDMREAIAGLGTDGEYVGTGEAQGWSRFIYEVPFACWTCRPAAACGFAARSTGVHCLALTCACVCVCVRRARAQMFKYFFDPTYPFGIRAAFLNYLSADTSEDGQHLHKLAASAKSILVPLPASCAWLRPGFLLLAGSPAFGSCADSPPAYVRCQGNRFIQEHRLSFLMYPLWDKMAEFMDGKIIPAGSTCASEHAVNKLAKQCVLFLRQGFRRHMVRSASLVYATVVSPPAFPSLWLSALLVAASCFLLAAPLNTVSFCIFSCGGGPGITAPSFRERGRQRPRQWSALASGGVRVRRSAGGQLEAASGAPAAGQARALKRAVD